MMRDASTVAVVGLGYVGLPLALAFGRKRPTIGFDVHELKIKSYQNGVDPAHEMHAQKFRDATQIRFTTDPRELAKAKLIIVAVPTPVDQAKRPDLSPLERACETVGKHMSRDSIVVFESTVYPGVTEDFCGTLLEKFSSFKMGVDFKLGYSPERINPGDNSHTLEKIVKVVSGQDTAACEEIASLYGEIIEPGVYRASSIKVAEAAKVIENTQRDLNIALMNELAIIFKKLGIDTTEVLDAAGTKWNFLPFRPGLVGGHCIGVDPYYLTHCAEVLGYHPEVILAGRRINDSMGRFIASETIKLLMKDSAQKARPKIWVLGLTFKENCGDLRNSRVIDVIRELESFGAEVIVSDPNASADEARQEYGIHLKPLEEVVAVDAIVAAVAHREIVKMTAAYLRSRAKFNAPFMDVKSAFDAAQLREAGFKVWRL